MLYPKMNEVRAVMDLSGVWNFRLGDETDPDSQLESLAMEDGTLKEPESMAVPASYNDQKDDPAYRRHFGWAFYEREISVPACWKGQRRVLRFDAVTHSARVYLNGKQIGSHKGGFLPFEVDVTDLLEPGKRAVLTVASDNRVNHSTLPVGNEGGIAFFGSDNAGIPSVEAAKKWCRPQNLPNFDFFNYAGINRPVRMYTTPEDYICDITLVPDYQGTRGSVEVTVEAVGRRKGTVQILDAEGKLAAEGEFVPGETIRLEIPDVRLWEPWPGTPYLYRAQFAFGEDRYEQTFGVRTIEVKGKQFLINGKPFYFKGFGKHEDAAFRGRGLDLCLDVRDVSMIHWLHANSFRTSHYPYAEEMYDLCDREGIVLIDETPAVGIGAGEKQDPYRTFPIKEHHEQVIRDMVARDKNHPCVVMWSMGNEPDTEHFPESAYTYWRHLYDLTHSLDPQNRPVTMVCCQNDYTKDIVTRTMDVVCINRYYGWYNLSGDLDAACYGLNQELDFWERIGKPLMITEYGADTVEGIHASVPEMFTEEFQVEYYRRQNAEFDRRDFFIGEHVWNFADFGTIQGCMRVGGNRKGLLTRDRRPKMAAHYFKGRWERIPNFDYKG